jgi:hypothetical protein
MLQHAANITCDVHCVMPGMDQYTFVRSLRTWSGMHAATLHEDTMHLLCSSASLVFLFYGIMKL